jgi:predicted glycosyltransferase
MRSRRLADRGLLTMLKDEDLQSDRLAALMDQKLTQSTRPAVTIDLDGAANTVTCIDNWLKNSG